MSAHAGALASLRGRPDIAVFAGTTEGRLLCERLSAAGIAARAFAATEYGAGLVGFLPGIEAHAGRLDERAMARALEGARMVVDATHPFAAVASRTIRHAAADVGARYVRLVRPRTELPEGVVSVESVAQAADFLAREEGAALITTGSKELDPYTRVDGFSDRFALRVLPDPGVLEKCLAAGFPASRIVAMQGPVSRELNVALLRFFGARWLVTKDAGAAGGLDDKLAAAADVGARAIVVARPVPDEEGMGIDEVCALLGA